LFRDEPGTMGSREPAALRCCSGRQAGGHHRNRGCATRTAMIGSVVTRHGRVFVPWHRRIVIVMVAVMLRVIGHSDD